MTKKSWFKSFVKQTLNDVCLEAFKVYILQLFEILFCGDYYETHTILFYINSY